MALLVTPCCLLVTHVVFGSSMLHSLSLELFIPYGLLSVFHTLISTSSIVCSFFLYTSQRTSKSTLTSTELPLATGEAWLET